MSAEEYDYNYKDNDDLSLLGPWALIFQALLDQHIYAMTSSVYDGAQVYIQPGDQNKSIMVPTPPGYEKQKVLTYYNE